jgi:hypothetical protein
MEEVPRLAKGREVQELKELQPQGMSIQAISKLTGWDRKTIREYVQGRGCAGGGSLLRDSARPAAFWTSSGRPDCLTEVSRRVVIF